MCRFLYQPSGKKRRPSRTVSGFFAFFTPQKALIFLLAKIYHPGPISISRVIAGHGQERGSIGVIIGNLHPFPVKAIWLEELPWWIRLYLHTLQVDINGQTIPKPFSEIRYSPAIDRTRPSVIEAILILPANSSIRIMMDFEKAFLRYTEYPYDAHRGFALPSAVLSYLLPNDELYRRIYTSTSLLVAPVPDFSMPYNVIVLTSTVIALIFGTIFNLLTRQFVAVDLSPLKKPTIVDPKLDIF